METQIQLLVFFSSWRGSYCWRAASEYRWTSVPGKYSKWSFSQLAKINWWKSVEQKRFFRGLRQNKSLKTDVLSCTTIEQSFRSVYVPWPKKKIYQSLSLVSFSHYLKSILNFSLQHIFCTYFFFGRITWEIKFYIQNIPIRVVKIKNKF